MCLRHYLPDGDAVPIYYFRLPFSADLSARIETLCTDIIYDDAVIIYLNDTEILSGNVPEEGYPYPNAYGCNRFYDEPLMDTVTLGRSLIRDGENIFSVELYQANENSADIYFSMGDWCFSLPQEVKLRNGGEIRETRLDYGGISSQPVFCGRSQQGRDDHRYACALCDHAGRGRRGSGIFRA